MLRIGALLPDFVGPSNRGRSVNLSRLSGRPLLLAFLGPLDTAEARAAWALLTAAPPVANGSAMLLGVGPAAVDHPDYDDRNRISVVIDPEGRFSAECGALDAQGRPAPLLVVADAQFRVVRTLPLDQTEPALTLLAEEARRWAADQAQAFAPVLTVPRIFEPAFCRTLIEYYETHGGGQSGFMRQVGGRTVPVHDLDYKRRQDCLIADEALRAACQARIADRLLPMVERAFGWRATRMERYIVARYAAEDRGFFSRHRDNTSSGTAHRKFAVTINLNAEDYEGGDLRFPEFGTRSYRAPTGGAVVFGCGLLHEATPVERGVRYAYLPFLYDEAGARLREANAHLNDDPSLHAYKADRAP